MPTDDGDELTPTDLDALTRAMAQARARSAGHSRQLDAKLKDESWEDVAVFAAYGCQNRNLDLRPWEFAPIHIDDIEAELAAVPDDLKRRRTAALLLQKMLALGISQFEPDPIAAIEIAEKRQQPAR